MRGVNFRVWDKANNCFWENVYKAHEGNLQDLKISLNGRLSIRTIGGKTIDESVFPDRFEITWLTEIKDKHGAAVYEKDILKTADGLIIEVFWNRLGPGGWWFAEHRGNDWYHAEHIDLRGAEKIGNVYENPELLRGKE